MTDSIQYTKWFSRITFLGLSTSMAYVVLQPSYNFAHWIPHALLRDLGVPYTWILGFEQNADILLHPVGSFLLTFLLLASKIKLFNDRLYMATCIIIFGVIATEFIQNFLGRGFDLKDLLLGVIGSLIASKLYESSTKSCG